jgi:hypothetical protein
MSNVFILSALVSYNRLQVYDGVFNVTHELWQVPSVCARSSVTVLRFGPSTPCAFLKRMLWRLLFASFTWT